MKKRTLIIIEILMGLFAVAMAAFLLFTLLRPGEPEPEYYGTSKLFNETTVDGVSLNKVRSLANVASMFRGEMVNIRACTEAGRCTDYGYSRFFNNDVDKSDVETIGVKFNLGSGQTVECWLFYDEYLRIGEIAKYYELVFKMNEGEIKVGEQTMSTSLDGYLKDNYGVKINGDEFEVKSSDADGDLVITGKLDGTTLKVYNAAEYALNKK